MSWDELESIDELQEALDGLRAMEKTEGWQTLMSFLGESAESTNALVLKRPEEGEHPSAIYYESGRYAGLCLAIDAISIIRSTLELRLEKDGSRERASDF